MIEIAAARAAVSVLPWRAIAAAGMAAATFAAGWAVSGWRKDAEIERVKTASAQADLAAARRALEDLQTASTTIRTKADEFNGIQINLGAKLDAIRKDMKNAKPLPADCRPDAVRVRSLSNAVDAANAAAAGQ